MNKVFAHSFWLMWGEHKGYVKPIERAWFLQTAPPYYEGRGVSIRIGRKSLRFGICWPRAHVTDRTIDWKVNKEVVDTVAWRVHDVDEKEIGKWGFAHDDQRDYSTSDTSPVPQT